MGQILFAIFYTAFSMISIAPSSASHDIQLNYFEYNRGLSSPVIAQIRIGYPGYFDYTFHDVIMYDYSFFPDNSIIPNAFIDNLFSGDIVGAVKAFTEPYYGIRFYHFFKSSPNIGWGIEFIHFKVFLPGGSLQNVHITGTDGDGNSIDTYDIISNYITYFNVSHGVNHLSFSLVYRLMLFQTEKIKSGILQPYVSLSFGICIPHPELKLAETEERQAYSYQLEFGNFGGGINLGFRLQFLRHLEFYFEYKFTFTWLYGMHFDNGQEGEIDASFTSNHFVWGLGLVF
ncbi:MAG: hypothetical protein GYA61_06320 [Spirochaetales bacterium]|jgi:hypothetical protein|nr:hypothetical protein [Exilispira sp.]NMC67823.1 hypothetical protein [Spirochaetales bacterium]